MKKDRLQKSPSVKGQAGTVRSLVLIFTAAALVGCQTSSIVQMQTAAPATGTGPLFHPMLITTPGTYPSPDSSWKIEVSDDSINFTRSTIGGDRIITRISNSIGFSPESHGWKAQAGWVVFVENESRVWAYNGGSILYMAAFNPSGCEMYYGSFRTTHFDFNYPCVVPPEVISHLPEEKQKEIQKAESTKTS